MKPRVMLFTRYPEPSLVKTRLIPALGPEGAARLHERMTEAMIGQLAAPELSEIDVEVLHAGGSEREMRSWLGERLSCRPQSGGDLGERLTQAFRSAFAEGAAATIAIGSDVPSLSASIVRSAFDALRCHDVVLGPTEDGGYYLIGMGGFFPELFANIPWGTETVFERTRTTVQKAGLTLGLLPRLQDIDRPEDLEHVMDLLQS